ncbi:MAG: ArsR family transcriptional regulator, partial [Proteobacteria bacterium]|nr:ArsR family transcriptional regulator [Pseudomonadota bacterium]
ICGQIVEMLPLAQSTVSQHLKILKDAGLIKGEVEGLCTCYCIDLNTLEDFRKMAAGL